MSQTGLSKLVKFHYGIRLQLHWILNTYEPSGGALNSLCSMENFYSGRSCMRFDLYRIFLAAVKFQFHQLCFLSGKKALRKYSKHCSQQSSEIWIIFSCQEGTQFPTVLHHNILSLKWQFWGKTYLFERKKKFNSPFFLLYALFKQFTLPQFLPQVCLFKYYQLTHSFSKYFLSNY